MGYKCLRGKCAVFVVVYADDAHGFVSEGYPMKPTNTAPKGTSTVESTASKAGRFTFYCDLPGHKERGMEGTLVVTGYY